MKKKNYIIAASVAAAACAAAVAVPAAAANAADADEQKQPCVYLVAGTYLSNGETQFNTVADGVKKLSADECAAISADNAYLCELEVGAPLPKAATERDGYTFNGWWGIEDATVVYYETVPDASADMYLYADFRAALSQPMKPVTPADGAEEKLDHYILVNRAATGDTLEIPLFVSGTDVPNAVQAGYGGPVQFYNEWFELQPGDELMFYVSHVYGSEPTLAPQFKSYRKITLEGNMINQTSKYLKCETDTEDPNFSGDYAQSIHGEPRCAYKSSEAHHFRIYIKFYDDGGTMTVYMENMDK